MANSELKKVVEKAFLLSGYIHDNNDHSELESIMRQYAEATNISFTEKELKEVIDYTAMLTKGNVTTYDELKNERF